jgi:Domain of unknown function (DUF5063)
VNYQELIARFVDSARAFCAWVEGPPTDNEPFEATHLVSRLYADAVMLPGVDDEHIPEEHDIPEVSDDQWRKAVERFKGFPFQYYREVFTPIAEKPEEPVVGDITDDFADIYKDVKSGLLAYELGREPQAVWHWRTLWGFHWGEHAVSALRALHSYERSS